MKYLPYTYTALCILVAGCSAQSPEPGVQPSSAPAPSENMTAAKPMSGPALRSTAAELRIVATSSVPTRAATPSGGGSGCAPQVIAPRSAGGAAVKAKGWIVTAEQEGGGYDVVSFVGAMEPGTSGTCVLREGNVAFFKGGQLRALAYAPQGASRSIGSIERLDTGDLRILDGDFVVQPLADIRFGSGGAVSIADPAKSDKVCSGRADVPNVRGMSIDKARSVLGKAGWRPATDRADPSKRDDRAERLYRSGVIEAESCSGTGLGYCSFAYRGAAGSLSVTTVGDGEWPVVSDYGVTCNR